MKKSLFRLSFKLVSKQLITVMVCKVTGLVVRVKFQNWLKLCDGPEMVLPLGVGLWTMDMKKRVTTGFSSSGRGKVRKKEE